MVSEGGYGSIYSAEVYGDCDEIEGVATWHGM